MGLLQVVGIYSHSIEVIAGSTVDLQLLAGGS